MSNGTSPANPIVFYDLLFNAPEKGISPFTQVVLWSLLYKRLPFERKLVELADVASVSQKVGFAKKTGALPYTLPAIVDPNTGAKIDESFDIAEYLDKTYADKDRPLLIPPGTRTLQKAFLTALQTNNSALFPLIIPASATRVTDYSFPYFKSSREAIFGKKLEELKPKADELAEAWRKFKEIFDTYSTWFEGGKGSAYLTGDEPVLADFYLAGRLFWIRGAFGKESKEWKEISSWHGGRWGAFLENITKKVPLE